MPQLEVAVVVLGVLLLLLELFADRIDPKWIGYLGAAGLGLVFLASWFVVVPTGDSTGTFWNFYAADDFALFFKRFALLTTVIVLVLMADYVRKTNIRAIGEFFALPIFTCAGLMYLASAIDFVSIFVSLELVSISFYVLVGFNRRDARSLEAGVKYLVLSALATGFFVYGITWLFGVTGSTNLGRIAAAFAHGTVNQTGATFGAVLVLVALGFKIAAVPFQLWVPDVYQGAPTPITAFLSVGSKAAGFAVLLRVLRPFMMLPHVDRLLVLIAVLTLIYGNLAALPQGNLKRLLAYSSIAHAGYLLIGVVCLDGTAVSFYLVAYLLMTLLSFAVLILVAQQTGESLSDFDGLSARAPFLAFAMLIAMVSLAGVPFTAGFFAKFLIFSAALSHHQVTLTVIGVVTVGCGFYYYLKVVRAMYWNTSKRTDSIPVTLLSRLTMTALMVAIVWFGVFPGPILKMLQPRNAAALMAHNDR